MSTYIDNAELAIKKRSLRAMKKLVPRIGVLIDLLKTNDITDEYDDVYGTLAGRSTDIIIRSTNTVSFTFIADTDDVLTMSIDKVTAKGVTFDSGVQTLAQVVTSINAVFSGLAVDEGTGKIKLKAARSIDIKDTSTALTVLGLTSAVTSNNSRLNVIITGDEFTPMNEFNIGALLEGFLYDPSNTMKVGDIAAVIRGGNRVRQFQLVEKDALGSTINVMDRFRISSIVE